MSKKWLWISIIVILLAAFLVWLFVESSKPLPGAKVEDLGREHAPVGTQVDYNSNPPTSGKHYPDWIRSGVYETPREDGYLIHSLEHGYVIMSYNCNQKAQSFKLGVKSVYAHGLEEEATTSSDIATSSAGLSDNFRSEDCHQLVDKLISIFEKKGKAKLIVVPRPNLDARIALTAWEYIDKFNDFDEQRIIRFIEAHWNQGPEKTVER